ncbi:MAG: P-loop NTPase fold protein [Methylococcales bacterium]|nr:P-loop NTPase fold protein [Methylococcales bacterium]
MSDSDIGDEWDGDVLNRKKYSVFLTKYLENKSEGCVININAPWGSGKTFFLEKWFEDVKKNHPAVYFNAWNNDYSNDPLVSIISCINEQIIPLLPSSAENLRTAKNFLSNSGKMMKKLAPIIIKGGLGKLIGEGGAEALVDITSEAEASITELASKFSEELLSHERISSSIDDFKHSVAILIREVTKNDALTSPLFVFIDELDRCRPLYSIELLERIKHIFDIPEVVFIVATDTQQLSRSVKAIYGEEFNGEIYLRRFFDQIYTLPEPNCIEFTTLLFEGFTQKAKYFQYGISPNGRSSFRANKTEENEYILTCKPHDHAEKILIFSLFAKFFKLDLRSQKQCFDRFVAIESFLSPAEELHFAYLIFLIMMDAKSPTIFQKYFNCPSHAERLIILKGFENSNDRIRFDFYAQDYMSARRLSEN